jgi:putative DNA primase/helicase
VIRHDPGELPAVLDQLQAAISAATHLDTYVYAGRLARVYRAIEAPQDGIRRAAGPVLVHPIEAPLLAELAGRAARHEKFDARSGGYKPCDCPRRVADALLARGCWHGFPELAGFIEAPTVTPDGRIIDAPGYDGSSGLFGAFGPIPGYARPPDYPTESDAARAAGELGKLLITFPFVSDADVSAMFAALITAVLRRMLPAAPLFGMDAPSPGTGKSLLAETVAIVATGRRAALMSLGQDDAETEKRLTSVLLAGDAVVVLDNIERPLRGDLLCQVTTQQFVRLRPLGATTALTVPTHAMFVATGNNLSILGDLKRRVVMIRLDAKVERPEQRTFDRDHLATVMEQRGKIITQVMTIVSAYIAAGSPRISNLHAFGSFEQWDRMVRRPLVWLGLPDPLQGAEALRESDPDLEASRMLYESWYAKFGSASQTTAAVVAAGMESMPMSGGHINPDLYDALQVICSEKPNARRLGYWLRAHVDRIVAGYALRRGRSDAHAKVATWLVEHVRSCG